MMTPCSQKLNQTKKKHFVKYVDCAFLLISTQKTDCAFEHVHIYRGAAKPMPSLFSQQADANSESDSEESSPQNTTEPSSEGKVDEDENPF